MPDAKRVAKFMQLLHAFQSVERVAHAPDLKRRENDVEHSYFLSMLCWYIVDVLELPLDKDLVLKYALVHDFVEVYAGDTYFMDPEGLRTKHEREEQARLRIQREFPEFMDMHAFIAGYEAKDDKEARFVYAVDKLIPLITNYLQKGHTWRKHDVGKEDLYALKRQKIGDEQAVRDLLEQFISEIDAEWQTYFNS